ncbi:MAG: hypothetical protein NUV46_03915 [Nanoarchaeota archaeon]|nr:hypothetical protein [Nanoarchaeota archaeon]
MKIKERILWVMFSIGIITSPILYEKVLINGNQLSLCEGKKIHSKSELEQIIEKRKKEFGFKGEIVSKIDSTGEIVDVGGSRKMESGKYEVILNKDYLQNKALEHELYHIFDGHCERGYDPISYIFWYEPKAMIHTLFYSPEENKK